MWWQDRQTRTDCLPHGATMPPITSTSRSSTLPASYTPPVESTAPSTPTTTVTAPDTSEPVQIPPSVPPRRDTATATARRQVTSQDQRATDLQRQLHDEITQPSHTLDFLSSVSTPPLDGTATVPRLDSQNLQVQSWLADHSQNVEQTLGADANRLGEQYRQNTAYNYVSAPVEQLPDGRALVMNAGADEEMESLAIMQPDGSLRRILDGNELAQQGRYLLDQSMSPDGRRLAYLTSPDGGDTGTWRVRDLETGRDIPNVELGPVRYSSLAWDPDGNGFTYTRPRDMVEGQADRNYEVRHFGLPTQANPRGRDVRVWGPTDPDTHVSVGRTREGRLLAFTSKGWDSNAVLEFTGRPGSATQPRTLVPDDGQNQWRPFGTDNQGNMFFSTTADGASRGRIVGVGPDGQVSNLIPEDPRRTIQSAAFANGQFVVAYKVDGHSELSTFTRDGRPQGSVTLPTVGNISDLHSQDNRTVAFSLNNSATPTTLYNYDTTTRSINQVYQPEIPGFNPNDYVSETIYAPSRGDGTPIPMTLTYRRGMEINRDTPVLMDVYGGFGQDNRASYGSANRLFLQDGGVMVSVHARGGGENGQTWYDAGRLENSRNTIQDIVGAAEYIQDRWGAQSVIRGASHGGFTALESAVAASREGLNVFEGVILENPLLNATQEGLGQMPNGTAYWNEQYRGSGLNPMADAQGVRLPPVLVWANPNDDRVPPAINSYPLAAQLQQTPGNQVFVDGTGGGHATGTLSESERLVGVEAAFFRWVQGQH